MTAAITLTPEPDWLLCARSLIGTREVPGPKSSPIIVGWATRLKAKLGAAYADDATPWCGLFVAHCIAETLPGEPLAKPAVRAKAWSTWGVAPPFEAPGAVLVFEREGGGHVGFYVGEDATHYHVLGGNQGDAVSIARVPKYRRSAVRWPATHRFAGRPVALGAQAAAVSRSEA